MPKGTSERSAKRKSSHTDGEAAPSTQVDGKTFVCLDGEWTQKVRISS